MTKVPEKRKRTMVKFSYRTGVFVVSATCDPETLGETFTSLPRRTSRSREIYSWRTSKTRCDVGRDNALQELGQTKVGPIR